MWGFVSAAPSTDLRHFVPTIVRLIVKPLSTDRLRWLLHRLCCTGLLDCMNWLVECQRKFWPTHRYHSICRSSCHNELADCRLRIVALPRDTIEGEESPCNGACSSGRMNSLSRGSVGQRFFPSEAICGAATMHILSHRIEFPNTTLAAKVCRTSSSTRKKVE